MIPNEVLALVGQVGTWVVFLYLYLAERKRNSEVQDARIKECREFAEALVRFTHPTGTQPRE